MWQRAAVVVVLCQVLAGCSLGGSSSGPSGPVASAAKLGVLRESFAEPRWYHRASSIAAVSQRLPIALVRPDAALASDRSLDSVWVSNAGLWRNTHIVLLWNSGVVETVDRWRCNCEASASLQDMGKRKPFRFLMLQGAPAITGPSAPRTRGAVV